MSFIELFDFIICQHQTRELTFYHQPPPKYPIYATSLIMFALPISKPRFKSIAFNQNSPKIMLFLQKNAKFSSTGGSAPRPPCLRRLGTMPPNQLSHCEFLATRLNHTKGMFYSFVVGLHPTLAK